MTCCLPTLNSGLITHNSELRVVAQTAAFAVCGLCLDGAIGPAGEQRITNDHYELPMLCCEFWVLSSELNHMSRCAYLS
jgi:hypothetical protein